MDQGPAAKDSASEAIHNPVSQDTIAPPAIQDTTSKQPISAKEKQRIQDSIRKIHVPEDGEHNGHMPGKGSRVLPQK